LRSTAKLNPVEHYAAITLCRTIVSSTWLALRWSRGEPATRYRAIEALCRHLDEDDRGAALDLVLPVAVALRTLHEHTLAVGAGSSAAPAAARAGRLPEQRVAELDPAEGRTADGPAAARRLETGHAEADSLRDDRAAARP
jgi:hypothetical protein